MAETTQEQKLAERNISHTDLYAEREDWLMNEAQPTRNEMESEHPGEAKPEAPAAITKKRDTPESAAHWDFVESTAKKVEEMPQWKQNAISTKPEAPAATPEHPLCADCNHERDDSRFHFEAPGDNWGAALHHFRVESGEPRTEPIKCAHCNIPITGKPTMPFWCLCHRCGVPLCGMSCEEEHLENYCIGNGDEAGLSSHDVNDPAPITCGHGRAKGCCDVDDCEHSPQDLLTMGALKWRYYSGISDPAPTVDLLSLAEQVVEAARPAFEILTALAAAVEWELHPSIVAKIRGVAPELGQKLLAWDAARKGR